MQWVHVQTLVEPVTTVRTRELTFWVQRMPLKSTNMNSHTIRDCDTATRGQQTVMRAAPRPPSTLGRPQCTAYRNPAVYAASNTSVKPRPPSVPVS